MIADSWKCILVSPTQLVKREIEKGTETGKIISAILRNGECLGLDIIKYLIENRINERDVRHRGYVVEGFPLIPNELLDYHSYSNLSTEESDIQNLTKNFMKLSADQEFKNKSCAMKPRYEFISNQLDEMFTTWPIKPSISIYVMCPDEDVVRKREHFRIDAGTGRIVDTSLAAMNRNIETTFANNRTENDVNISFELYRELMNEERILDENQGKYLLKRVSDRKSNVEAQCKLYKHFAMAAIDKWILLHKPENVIRLDGRSAVSQMFQIVISRLRTLPVPRVILPTKFLDLATMKFDGETSAMSAPIEEFEGKSNEEAFQVLANRETVSPMYPWSLSAWNFLCPVELARGRTVEGTSKFAVRFMDKIFFLSSAETTDLFIENPRTFVLSFAPRPTCKIAVFGPKYSGKSDLCKTLANVFGGTVINVNQSDSDSNIFFDSMVYAGLQEKTDFLVKKILDVPKEEIDVGVWRDGSYIVDGIYPDIDCWKMIVEDSNILFEDAILLYDEDPYEYLLSKWRSSHDSEKFEEEHEEWSNGEDSDGEEQTQGLAEYLRHIRQFELDWEATREKVTNSCRNLITCNLSKIDDIFGFVMENIKDRYVDKAREMSDVEKEREKDLAEYMAMTDNTENVGEGEDLRDEEGTVVVDNREDNRRLGDTDQYCPVALIKYNVFWKGKEDFSALFMNKIYLLSNDAALQEFLHSPQKLSIPFRRPLSVIPPLRVSIIGPLGSGKSMLADAISREYGLAHIDYFKFFSVFVRERGIRPSILHRCQMVLPQDHPEEVDLPEYIDDEKYIRDASTLQTLIRRYWNEGSELPKKILRECLLEFFEGRYKKHGLVMEQFPSCPQDVQMALDHYTVPEIIIELRCDKDKAHQRIIPELLKLWQESLLEKKRKEQLRHMQELKSYHKDKNTWVRKSLMEEMDDLLHGQEADEFSWQSQFELEEIWRNENPLPIPFIDWEDYETAKLRIEKEFEETYANDSRKIEAMREAVQQESIQYAAINTEGTFKDILLRVMRILSPYIDRDVSVLERPRTIDLETAEMLLDCGYYLQSSFGRWCPVQLYKNQTPLQMFLPSEARQEIYPVTHRQFLYFLTGKDACSEFLKNPLKYLEQDSCAPVIPFRLSIIGPPKCGKTSLARRFAAKYGLRIVTRGSAVRHLVEYFPWTESAQFAKSHLRAGRIAPEESLSRAVEMYCIDPRSTSQGFVLDGFPSSRKEFESLSLLGIQPIIVLDLKANLTFCTNCLSRGADETKKPANFSSKFLEHRYANWNADRVKFREWLKKFTQNVIDLEADKSMWHVWTRADREVCFRYACIRSYFRESDYDKCHRLQFMSVSPYEFKKRHSKFESYCPACLFYENALTTCRSVPDQRGMIQFREHFYWVCMRHADDFMLNPQKYLPPVNTACLPEDRPRVLTETIDVEHSCWARRLRIAGFCPVTYVENLPHRKLLPGKSTIGALYKDQVYLFCTDECREKFLTYPDKYAEVNVKFFHTLPPIDVKNLPDLGFLEQTVATVIVEAVNQVCVIRPKLPGLSPSTTAAICIGVYLKTCNVSCMLKETKIYDKVARRIYGRHRILQRATYSIKKKRNPFIKAPVYPEGINDTSIGCYRNSTDISILSDIFPRMSNFITFRRTSPTQLLVDPSEESDD
ncbi:Adenylate kinase domain-containing protein 1 [Dufourea novaeangliae]|uniref:Adenylate kinase domain-containing protein 1 n=1 Tax=Dufourea novaeangliae TaxID=178035 RepID=A0A154PF56_DUFNO|nr:Adenylate kinase domain-containing protein 1 [Dufourea novaeangliae]